MAVRLLLSRLAMRMPAVVLAGAVAAACVDGCARTGLDEGPPAPGGAPARGSASGGAGGTPGASLATETTGGTAGTTSATATDPADGGNRDCIIAIRTDVCCSDAFVISRHEMDEDPCVQPYQSPVFLPKCRPPGYCDTADCVSAPPLTRLAGRGPDGTCQFLTECQTVGDCLWGFDLRNCCGCATYYPRSLVEVDPCLQDPASPRASASCSSPNCASVRCADPPLLCPRLPPACASNPDAAAAGLRVCTGQLS